ncbi:MAG: CCA tRNA nucleotidyltransferase [Planctomycetota bacterium]
MSAITLREDALLVIRRLRDAGHVALLAGGCVRDELMGLEPKDFDVATDAVPDRVREVFGRHLTQAVGAAFGVMLVRQNRSQIEVATFRADGSYSDGRRPDGVRFTNAKEDAERRDFTINGLFRDPFARDDDPDDDGVIDHVGGRRDLKAKVLRCIGDPERRFGEDYLRLLRAVRFAARFDLTIHPATWRSLCDNAFRITGIAAERVGDELRRMLVVPSRGQAWELLWQSGLIGPIFRDMPIPNDAPNRSRPFTRAMAEVSDDVPFASAIAATLLDLAHQAGVPTTEAVRPEAAQSLADAGRRSLRLSNAETDAVRAALSLWPVLEPATHGSVAGLATTRRFLGSPHVESALPLLRTLARDRNLGEAAVTTLDELGQVRDRLPDILPAPLISGDDLLTAGWQPGPHIARALTAAYDAQLEGRITTRDEALAVANSVG